MAVDTRDKRASALGFPGVVYSNPDGSLNLGDRQQAVGMYRGIDAADVVVSHTGVPSLVAGYGMDLDAGHRMALVSGYRMEIIGG